MKKVIFGAIALIVGFAGIAQAQQQHSVNAKIIGVEIAPGSWVRTNGMPSFGMVHTATGDKSFVVSQKKDTMLSIFAGYKPLGGFGGEVRFQKFGAQVQGNGTVGQTDGIVFLWGVDDTPHIVSSAPVLNGPVGYTLASSAKFSRIDFLGNYSLGFNQGWVSVFAGVPILYVESSEDVARAQSFLLYTLNPDRTLSNVGDREDYNFSSTASSKTTFVGVVGGVEGELCLFGNLVAEGRFAVAKFPWGSGAKVMGQFSATKDIYLINVAGGLTGTPTQTLAHLNWAPTSAPYSETVKQSVTGIDAKVAVKWAFKTKQHTSFTVGFAVSRSSLRNMPITPGYVIKDGFAIGNGKWASRTTNMSVTAPMLTVSIWF